MNLTRRDMEPVAGLKMEFQLVTGALYNTVTFQDVVNLVTTVSCNPAQSFLRWYGCYAASHVLILQIDIDWTSSGGEVSESASFGEFSRNPLSEFVPTLRT
jgi:hypothetical protein